MPDGPEYVVSRPIDLTGRVAVVTGAGRGIGRGIAIALARAGADLVAADINFPDETVEAIRGLGRRAVGQVVDVRVQESVQGMVDTCLREFGKLEILVNNAGIVERKNFETLTVEEWDQVLAVNARASFLTIHAALPAMRAQGYGKIVNISSVSGQAGGAVSKRDESPEAGKGRSGPAYAASKGAVLALTKWAAKDLARWGIYVNAVAPGAVATPMTAGFDYGVGNQPIPRYAEPEDIAQAVLFLASDAANYITGHTMDVNGGLYLR